MAHGFPNFNFNTSHDGHYVAMASEPVCLVGLDDVYHSIPEKESVEEFIQHFSSYLSNLEWSNIMILESLNEMLNQFYRRKREKTRGKFSLAAVDNLYRYWCLKEAFSKAICAGVGNRPDALEFHHAGWDDIVIEVDSKEMTDWRFWLLELENCHSVCIARGYPRVATPNYRKMLKQMEVNVIEYDLGLNKDDSCFLST